MSETRSRPDSEKGRAAHSAERRTLLAAALGATLGVRAAGFGPPPKKRKLPREQRPQAGDLLVFRFGKRAGKPLGLDDLAIGGDLVQGVTRDPATGVVRDGSRLNGLNVVRFHPADLTPATRTHAARGVLAYSSVCTHQGCDLSQLLPKERVFKCYCHYSKFDPRDGGKVVDGPARRPLAILPLAYRDGRFIAVSGFIGKVGFKRKR